MKQIGVVITRNHPPNREVLCDVQRGIAIYSPGIEKFEGMELGIDTCRLRLKQLLLELNLGWDLDSWLDDQVTMHPSGQTYAQIRGVHAHGGHPVPDPQSAYLYPRDVWRVEADCKKLTNELLHVRMWSIQLDPATGMQAKGVWLPADEATLFHTITNRPVEAMGRCIC